MPNISFVNIFLLLFMTVSGRWTPCSHWLHVSLANIWVVAVWHGAQLPAEPMREAGLRWVADDQDEGENHHYLVEKV